MFHFLASITADRLTRLLVGYGFILDKPETDVVNISLVPPPEIQAFRRTQACHISQRNHCQPDEEWRYQVFKHPVPLNDGRPGYWHLKHGVVETISCIVANDRERRFLAANPDYCLESDLELNSSNMSRNIIHAYQVLHGKLQAELQKLHITGANLV